MLGTRYIQYQKDVNTWKKSNASQWWVKNNWVYTGGMCFIVLNFIFFTRLLLPGDKAVITSLINIDETIAKLNLTEDNADDYFD